MDELTQQDRIAAKLLVLIECVADHKITPYDQKMLVKEVVADIIKEANHARSD